MGCEMTYKCSQCGRSLTANHDGQGNLGTWTCPVHGARFVTVIRDLSGGKEANRNLRKSAMTVKRHTKVERSDNEQANDS